MYFNILKNPAFVKSYGNHRKTMNVLAADALAVHKRCLSPLGIWPLDDDNIFKKARFLLAIWLQLSITALATFEVYIFSGDISEKMDIYLIWVCGILASARHIQIYIHRDKLGKSVQSLIKDWETIKDGEYLEIMQSHADISRIFSQVLVSTALTCLSFFFMQKIVLGAIQSDSRDDYKTVLPTWFLTKERAVKWYWPWTVYQCCQCVVACVTGPASDGFIFAIVSHLSGQFEILNLQWSSVGTIDNKSKKKLHNLFRKHIHLVKLGEDLENSLSDLFLAHMAVNIICIGASGLSFLISVKNGDWMTATVGMMAINVLTSQSLVYCYLGDYLRSESEAVMNAVYCSFWYNLKIRDKKNLLFVMMKASRPVSLRAGKFFNMTRSTFITMIKTAASYLSVLRIMIENE